MDELLEMVKEMKIKHSVSFPEKYGSAFFSKKIVGEGMFYMGFNIRLCKEGRKVSKMHVLVILTV